MDQITPKKIGAVLVFLAGAFLGASTRTIDYPLWASIGAIMAAIAICWCGIAMWQSDTRPTDNEQKGSEDGKE